MQIVKCLLEHIKFLGTTRNRPADSLYIHSYPLKMSKEYAVTGLRSSNASERKTLADPHILGPDAVVMRHAMIVPAIVMPT